MMRISLATLIVRLQDVKKAGYT